MNALVLKIVYLRKAFVNMNRLVIIGNGFDLAHGLPTKYSDFINDYWKNLCDTKGTNTIINKNDEFVAISCQFYNRYNTSQYNTIDDVKSYRELMSLINRYSEEKFGNFKIEFKNLFFKKISENSIENWVDIENEYYRELKEIVSSKSLPIKKQQQAIVLNNEFEEVKNLLKIYLLEKVVNIYNLDFTKNQNINWMNVCNLLKPISLFSNEENILKEFISIEDVNEIKEHFEKERKEELVNNLYFLNFNYTSIASTYSELSGKDDRIESRMNFIHGSLENVLENKINFGFGDEMDDEYRAIENLNDNEYLKNFKSFQYLQNSNYNDLLRYIDSDKFQVLIMGHSCGLSDRTLLNTIFEHNNCRSIKVFYHKKEDGTDNYTEIIQNISRHFNKKKLMREKIVNKTLCQPLPQIQLPLR